MGRVQWHNTFIENFAGDIDELKVWNRELFDDPRTVNDPARLAAAEDRDRLDRRSVSLNRSRPGVGGWGSPCLPYKIVKRMRYGAQAISTGGALGWGHGVTVC
ncbi:MULTISPECIES: hypothetical protein [unclassified Nonomuraea]|uniref:hypothetical protein n=1 Tax=unclassified Nonomuraea TaxID=2593643 RepID=UPI0033F0629F